jgi:hypothetical protein
MVWFQNEHLLSPECPVQLGLNWSISYLYGSIHLDCLIKQIRRKAPYFRTILLNFFKVNKHPVY